MSVPLHKPAPDIRTTRLSVMVSPGEAGQIAGAAEAAGLSVSAFLRGRALGVTSKDAEAAALRQIDALIDRMTGDLDAAIAQLSEVLARLDPH